MADSRAQPLVPSFYPPGKVLLFRPRSPDVASTNAPVIIYTKPEDRQQTLSEINDVWKNGWLFDQVDSPNSVSYEGYLEEIKKVLEGCKKYFSKLTNRKNKNFKDELTFFVNNKAFSPLQRAVYSTMALELALLGIDPSVVISEINPCKPDHAKGFVNELKAGWFLAKFIYRLEPSTNDSFIHSEMLYNGKEIDIHTRDALVSVKSTDSSFPAQIRDLFLCVLNDRNGGLKESVKRIILINSSENHEEYMPTYNPFWEIERSARLSRRLIGEKLGHPVVNEIEELFDRIVTKGLTIYHLPDAFNFQGMKEWIRLHHINMGRQ